MAIVYIIHGFVGAGKTTFAKRLERETSAKRFTPDEIIVKRYGKNLSVEEIRNANLAVKEEIYKEVETAIQEARDVILDYGLWKKQQRIELIQKVQKLGGKPIVYEVICDPIIMKQRALERNEDGDIAITPERYDMYYKRFEPMDKNEERITVCKSPMNKKINRLAIIGGDLLYKEIEGIKIKRYYDFKTPFGEVTAPIIEMELNGNTFFYLRRHGSKHDLLPHEINYRANIYALKMLGVTRAIGLSVTSIESLKKDLLPGQIIVPNQYLDWTKNRKNTFFGNGLIVHIPMTNPCCPSLAKDFSEVAKKLKIKIDFNRTLACIEGPRFLTKAENQFLLSVGCDAVGMSCIPEAFLAREAQMAYSTLAIISDNANRKGIPNYHKKLKKSNNFYDQKIWENNTKKAVVILKNFITNKHTKTPDFIRSSLVNTIKTPINCRSEYHNKILSVLTT
jgi:5'-methylthioadenosine phosphorylase